MPTFINWRAGRRPRPDHPNDSMRGRGGRRRNPEITLPTINLPALEPETETTDGHDQEQS
jgi:hypothetical protein